MPFTEHLEELRWHILRSLLYVLLAGVFCWCHYKAVYHLISHPVIQAFQGAGLKAELVYLDVLEPLMLRIQIVLGAGVVLALPFVLWEAWRFIAPGLYATERRYVGPLLPFSLVLCFLGVTLVYYALPIAFGFLLRFGPDTTVEGDAQLMQHLQRYLFFLVRMMIGAAVAFQTPIVVLLMGQLELVTVDGLLRYWRHAVLICFTVAAVITPTIDPFNMSIIALPLCALYFLSVALVWWVERGRAREAAKHAASPPDPPAVAPLDEPPPPLPPPAAAASTPPAPPAKQDLGPTATPSSPAAPTVIDRSALGPLAVPPGDDDEDDEPWDDGSSDEPYLESDEESAGDDGNRDDP